MVGPTVLLLLLVGQAVGAAAALPHTDGHIRVADGRFVDDACREFFFTGKGCSWACILRPGATPALG
jgi:hypothetical protein